MKKHYLTKSLMAIIALHFSSVLFAQQSKIDFTQLKKQIGNQQLVSLSSNEKVAAADIKYLPALAKNYYWDSLTATFLYMSEDLIKYNTKGDIISKTTYSINSTDSSSKTIFKYFPNGGKEEINQIWNGIGWENSYRYLTLKDSYDNEIEYTRYSWQKSTKSWLLENGDKSTYMYDKQARIVEEIQVNYSKSMWENSNKRVYTYANITDKGFNTITSYAWQNNNWIEEFRAIDIVWKNFENFDVLSYLEQKYVKNAWINSTRSNLTYTGKDYIEISETYIEGKWVNDYKTTSSYDVAGNNTVINQTYENGVFINTNKNVQLVDTKGVDAGFQDYEWINNAWLLKSSYTSTNTYNLNGALVESINENISKEFSSKSKTIYSNFIQVATGTTDRSITDILNVYPIPAKDYITISPVGNEPLTFKIINGMGTEIPTNFSTNKVDVSQWASGIYFLNIRTEAGKNYTKKLIKE